MNTIELVIYVLSVLYGISVATEFVEDYGNPLCLQFVSTTERLVVLRLGRAQKTRGPGATFVLPCIDNTYKISTTITAFNVTPMNTIELVIYVLSVLFVVLTLPFSLLFVMKFVSTTERLVVLRLGRAQKTRGPGATFVLPCIDNTYKISTTITAFNVPPLQDLPGWDCNFKIRRLSIGLGCHRNSKKNSKKCEICDSIDMSLAMKAWEKKGVVNGPWPNGRSQWPWPNGRSQSSHEGSSPGGKEEGRKWVESASKW
ncbi:hypothetical protein ANCDUO_08741 [Ancylostoma duodenale]|uniref:Band 7 domain-containing protein n=1 Tax=Ancylostoma duodenale TaxID=51022 RepID=A0A0C2CVR9_9BILA|nr:hypothetical protein ANCDUO_08741 [Ancylostoma duodenale]